MYCLFFGLAWWLIVLYQWFSEAIHESETGMYGRKIDLSYRWSMTWFIFSEGHVFRCVLHGIVVGAFTFHPCLGQP